MHLTTVRSGFTRARRVLVFCAVALAAMAVTITPIRAADPADPVEPVDLASPADPVDPASPADPASSGSHRGRAGRWSAVWAAAPQPPNAGKPWLGSNWSLDGFADQSIRQVVRVSGGGTDVRIRLSNLYGRSPLRITGASIARATSGAAVRPDTIRTLTFTHRRSATIPAGGQITSDATRLATTPLDTLAVTLYMAEPTGPATFHELGLTTTYRASGNHLADPTGEAFDTGSSHSWYYLAGVDVAGGSERPEGTVVTIGDSITDGAISTPDANNRYPDELAERLATAGTPRGVANVGLNGGRLLHDSPCYGERGVTRFRRDVLGQPGVRTVIVLLGINDIIHPGMAPEPGCDTPPVVTAAQVIQGHRALIRAAHAHGVGIVGATLLPFEGNPYFHSDAAEAIRDRVNHWIRTSGEYDAVVDLDRALADPADPDALRSDYAAFDDLHPNDAGMAAIATTIDLRTL